MDGIKAKAIIRAKDAGKNWNLWIGLGLFWSWFWVYLIKPSGLEFEFVAQASALTYRITALLSIIVCFLAITILRLRFPSLKIPKQRSYVIALIVCTAIALLLLFPIEKSAMVEALQLMVSAVIAALLFVGWGDMLSSYGVSKAVFFASLALVVAILCSILTFLLDFGQQDLLMALFPIVSALLLMGLSGKAPEGQKAEQASPTSARAAEEEEQRAHDDDDNSPTEKAKTSISLVRLRMQDTPWRFFSILFFQGLALGVWQFLYDLVVLEKCTAEYCFFRELNDLFVTRGLPEFVGFASVIGLILALLLVVLSVYVFHMNFRKLMYQIGLPLMALGFLIIAFDGGIVLAGASYMTGDIFIYGEIFHTAGYYYILIIAWVLCSYLVTEKRLDGVMLLASSGLFLMLGQLVGYALSGFLGSWSISGTDLCMLAIFVLLSSGLITATGGESLWQEWGNARPTQVKSMGIFRQACVDVSQQYGLTPRETEVFTLLARGRNLSYIQSELFISRDTSKSHLRNIYRKLGIHSQQELINLMEKSIKEKRR